MLKRRSLSKGFSLSGSSFQGKSGRQRRYRSNCCVASRCLTIGGINPSFSWAQIATVLNSVSQSDGLLTEAFSSYCFWAIYSRSWTPYFQRIEWRYVRENSSTPCHLPDNINALNRLVLPEDSGPRIATLIRPSFCMLSTM